MRTHFILLTLLLCYNFSFSQKLKDKEEKVQYTQLPHILMSEVKTYDCAWDVKFKDVMPDIETEWGYNLHTVKGFLTIQGYTYSDVDPDIIITLIGNSFEIPTPQIKEINSTNYRAIFKFPFDWQIKIDGKFTKLINLNEITNSIDVVYPPLEDKYGVPSQTIPNAEVLEKHLSEKSETVSEYVTEQALFQIFIEVSEIIKSELAYLKKEKEVELYYFKSNKKVDMTAWDKPFEQGKEMLNKINQGINPYSLYTEYKSTFDFWNTQFEQHKADVKENDDILKASLGNLIGLLAMVNPNEIKDEYLDVWNKVKGRKPKFIEFVADSKKRQTINSANTYDYAQLNKSPLIKSFFYEMMYSTEKGGLKPGIIRLSTPYGLNPFEMVNTSGIYDLEIYKSLKGNVSSKNKLNIKNIKSFELLGAKYVKIKYTDPTAVTIGGTEIFMEELVSGKLSLYKFHLMESSSSSMVVGAGVANYSSKALKASRNNKNFVISLNGKSTMVFNYSKLTDILKDSNEVSDKIKQGAYGNKPIEKKSSKLGRFMQQGIHNEIDGDIVVEIAKDYNSKI